MPNLTIYGDSGFVTLGSPSPNDYIRGSHPTWKQGDKATEEYIRTPHLGMLDKTNPALIIEIARKAVELFGSNKLEFFITANLKHAEFKSELHFKFLEDTIEYLKTGVRSMAISMWISLLTDSKDTVMKNKAGLKPTYSMNPKSYRNLTVQDWLSKDGGLSDLVFSMFIIFGEHRKWLH